MATPGGATDGAGTDGPSFLGNGAASNGSHTPPALVAGASGTPTIASSNAAATGQSLPSPGAQGPPTVMHQFNRAPETESHRSDRFSHMPQGRSSSPAQGHRHSHGSHTQAGAQQCHGTQSGQLHPIQAQTAPPSLLPELPPISTPTSAPSPTSFTGELSALTLPPPPAVGPLGGTERSTPPAILPPPPVVPILQSGFGESQVPSADTQPGPSDFTERLEEAVAPLLAMFPVQTEILARQRQLLLQQDSQLEHQARQMKELVAQAKQLQAQVELARAEVARRRALVVQACGSLQAGLQPLASQALQHTATVTGNASGSGPAAQLSQYLRTTKAALDEHELMRSPLLQQNKLSEQAINQLAQLVQQCPARLQQLQDEALLLRMAPMVKEAANEITSLGSTLHVAIRSAVRQQFQKQLGQQAGVAATKVASVMQATAAQILVGAIDLAFQEDTVSRAIELSLKDAVIAAESEILTAPSSVAPAGSRRLPTNVVAV